MKFEAEALTFSYPKGSPVFRDISIKAEAGEILSVLGPNGAGKTTLLRCLLGFLKPEGGRVLIDGQGSGEIPAKEFWKRAAYVPQGRAQAFPYTVDPYAAFQKSHTPSLPAALRTALSAGGSDTRFSPVPAVYC